MANRDLTSLLWADISSGFGLLTRLPVAASDAAPRPEAVWAWPIIGAVVGALSAAAGMLAIALGLPAAPTVVLVLITGAMLTGGLHEDGLADSADGFFGGRDAARRLEIMKDSRIGSHGAVALLLVTLLRWSALVGLVANGQWGAIVAAGAISRAPMALIMAHLPNARTSGLSHGVGRPTPHMALLAAAMALALGLACQGFGAFVMAALAGLVTLALAWMALARIGGQTGDILGASQQLAEAAALLAAAALV